MRMIERPLKWIIFGRVCLHLRATTAAFFITERECIPWL